MRSKILRGTTLVAMAAAVGVLFAGTTGVRAEDSYQRVSEPNLVSYTVKNEFSIEKPLAGKIGNAANGKKLFVHRKKGNCLTCHQAPISEEEFHGQVAPDLAGVGSRMTVGEIRLRLVNPKMVNPDTMMMSFYRTHGLNQVKKGFIGKPMLNEQEIEDVVAYLASLK